MSKRPIVLHFDKKSPETVACLEALLESARERKLVGLAFVAFLSRRQYYVHTTGIADVDPTRALGAAHVLCDDLSARVRSVND